MTTLTELHDMLVAPEGFNCTCPNDCDAIFAARLRRKRQVEQMALADRPDGPKGQLGTDHEDWPAGY